MLPIRTLPHSYDVAAAVAELTESPEVWNRYRDRLDRYGSPHSAVSDVWVRFNDWAHFNDDPLTFFQGPHESVWYPCVEQLPAVKALVMQVFRDVGGTRLGGVLITRIPPGEKVQPHVDTGWHAGYYQKYAVQLMGNARQAFCFENAELRPEAGQLYTFRNDVLHWVTNDSEEDRMTLIICLRTD